jgi:hypothetical protein
MKVFQNNRMASILYEALVWILISAISAIPLNLAVKALGGKSSWLKAILVNIILDIINIFLSPQIRFGYIIISFILKLFIYKLMFRIGWIKALLAWILQYIIAVLLVILLAVIGLGWVIALPFFL